MPDLLIDDDDDLLLEPRQPEPGLSPADEGTVAEALRDRDAVAPIQPMGLMQLLPADFPLPTLIRFVPDARLKQALDDATAKAMALEVTGAEGMQRADVALAAVRDTVKAVREHFDEPAAQAHALHSSITSRRAEWLKAGENALAVVGRRVAAEKARLQAIADDQRRKEQDAANERERERRRQEAAEAEKAQAPARVVEQMKQEAEKAQAPPVPVAAAAPPQMSRNTVVTTWKARIKGTPADDEPNPEMADLSPAQLEQVRVLLRAVADGTEPMACFAIDWGYLNRRAKAEEKTFAIAGMESFPDSNTRGKGGRKVRI